MEVVGRCQAYKDIKVTDTFYRFTIKSTINFAKGLINLFSCRTCGKQYTTGKTTDRFRYWWNNYEMEARKAESGDMENVKQNFLQSSFLQDDQRFAGRY